jgi:hypothetical protein
MEHSVTPLPVASPPPPPSHYHRSGLDSLLSKLPGTAVQLYALHQLQPVVLASMGLCADQRWRWVLLSFVVVVVPTFASSALDTARQFLANKQHPHRPSS